jgi:hypothetical protein
MFISSGANDVILHYTKNITYAKNEKFRSPIATQYFISRRGRQIIGHFDSISLFFIQNKEQMAKTYFLMRSLCLINNVKA